MDDITMLLDSFSPDQQSIICEMVVRIARAKQEKFTGAVQFGVNFNQGGFGDMEINQRDVFRVAGKRRKVRAILT